jgi:hypothetical protein
MDHKRIYVERGRLAIAHGHADGADDYFGNRRGVRLGPRSRRLACEVLLNDAPQDEKSGNRAADHEDEPDLTHE